MKRFEREAEVLGTRVRVLVVAHDEERALRHISLAMDEARRIERTYSRFRNDSDLMQMNSRLGEWQEVEYELYALIEFGERMRQQSKGAFDLTVQSVLEGWGYDADYSLQEGEAGQMGHVELRNKDELHELKLSAPIDLGGLGKGYAVDRMASRLEGFANVLVEAGGDLFCRGVDEDGEPWKIALEHPVDPEMALAVIQLPESRLEEGMAFASSSASRRKWGEKHHLVNPEVQLPAENMLAVYVQAAACLHADAWATALYVLGFEEAQKLLNSEKLPIQAILVAPDGKIWES